MKHPTGGAIAAAMTLACVVLTAGCSKDEGKSGTAASASAPVASTPPPPSAAPPAAAPTASAAPAVDCAAVAKGTLGDGTFAKPCNAKGAARQMEVSWNGKSDDKGPFFRVASKATSTILYGRMAVYFYDKAGKPVLAKDKPFHTCGGNMFQGAMKAGEKAVIQFSCVRKEDVPAGATAIEAEMSVVGYTDDEKKVSWYWGNPDLTPDGRKKGGVK